ncbi:MAG: hypothetical protein IPO27_05720 [Bacteroidetes bacterium]|nr:hypothetical protein [Bacteroidota bacterium]
MALLFTDRNVGIYRVSINGGGNAAVVALGHLVSLSYSVVANFNINNVYCPGCIYQGYIGIWWHLQNPSMRAIN